MFCKYCIYCIYVLNWCTVWYKVNKWTELNWILTSSSVHVVIVLQCFGDATFVQLRHFRAAMSTITKHHEQLWQTSNINSFQNQIILWHDLYLDSLFIEGCLLYKFDFYRITRGLNGAFERGVTWQQETHILPNTCFRTFWTCISPNCWDICPRHIPNENYLK